MTSSSGIPRPFSITEAKRDREEEARRREQATSARNTSSTTIGSGGRLDVVGGDLTVSEGGNASVKDGGAFRVEGGGSMEIVDDGEVKVIGNGRGWAVDEVIRVVATFANRMAYNAWIGYSYLVPGLYFTAEGESKGPYDPRVVSKNGKDVSTISGVEKLPYGPQVGPTILSKSTTTTNTWNAGFGSRAWDEAINPGGEDGIAGVRGRGSFSATPYDIDILLTNHTDGPDGIPSGPAVWIYGTLADGKLELYGRNGVNVTGPLTVDGAPVGGAVDSVAGKTGAVTLVKGDVGLGNVDNTSDAAKPVSTATQAALDGKASTAVATTTVNGLMASTDKSKLNASTPNTTANALIQRDTSGRAKVADPAVAADIANKQYVDSQNVPTHHAEYTATTTTTPFSATTPGTLNLSAAPYSENAAAICTVTAAGKIRIEQTGFYSIDWFGFHGGVAAGADSYMNISSTHRTDRITSIDIPAESGSSALALGSIYIPAGAVIGFQCAFRNAQPNLRSFITIHKLR